MCTCAASWQLCVSPEYKARRAALGLACSMCSYTRQEQVALSMNTHTHTLIHTTLLSGISDFFENMHDVTDIYRAITWNEMPKLSKIYPSRCRSWKSLGRGTRTLKLYHKVLEGFIFMIVSAFRVKYIQNKINKMLVCIIFNIIHLKHKYHFTVISTRITFNVFGFQKIFELSARVYTR